MNQHDREKLVQAGEIARAVIEYARNIIRKGMSLKEIAERIERKIHEEGGKPAFPVNLSINDIAAHATPTYDDTGVAHGLLKVDIGVHIDGMIADTAFSIDLENNALNRNLILSAQKSLNTAVALARYGSEVTTIGKAIGDSVAGDGFSSVRNLTGHSIEKYNVHAGTSIPNYDSGQTHVLKEGVYAIEPFVTNGAGSVRDGRPSGIYHFSEPRPIRDSTAREVAAFIISEYEGLPFCSRWIHARFGGRGLLALKVLEQAGVLYHYAHLVEIDNGIVAQAEHTLLVEKGKTVVIT